MLRLYDCGWGDTIAAINKFIDVDMLDYVSTGGGAFMEFFEKNGNIPAIEALNPEFTYEEELLELPKLLPHSDTTDSPQKIEQLIAAGVDVVRLNFSHGTAKEHIQELRGCTRQHTDLKEMLVLWLIFKDQKYNWEI